jgi:ribonuclease HI
VRVYAYTDGASRGNPGKSASGYDLRDSEHRLVFRHIFYNGICTNNVAEYAAVIAALKKALELFGEDVDIVLASDSSLVINQLSGSYKVKSQSMKRLNTEARELLGRFRSHRLLSVSRKNAHISRVDAQLNALLDGKGQKAAKVRHVQRQLKAN